MSESFENLIWQTMWFIIKFVIKFILIFIIIVFIAKFIYASSIIGFFKSAYMEVLISKFIAAMSSNQYDVAFSIIKQSSKYNEFWVFSSMAFLMSIPSGSEEVTTTTTTIINQNTKMQDIEAVSNLYDKGHLSESEYKKEKQIILDRME
jgi:hypothetical protein